MCLKFDINTFDARSDAMNQKRTSDECSSNRIKTKQTKSIRKQSENLFTLACTSHVTLCLLQMLLELWKHRFIYMIDLFFKSKKTKKRKKLEIKNQLTKEKKMHTEWKINGCAKCAFDGYISIHFAQDFLSHSTSAYLWFSRTFLHIKCTHSILSSFSVAV